MPIPHSRVVAREVGSLMGYWPGLRRKPAPCTRLGCWHREKGQPMLSGQGHSVPTPGKSGEEGSQKGTPELAPEGQTEA